MNFLQTLDNILVTLSFLFKTNISTTIIRFLFLQQILRTILCYNLSLTIYFRMTLRSQIRLGNLTTTKMVSSLMSLLLTLHQLLCVVIDSLHWHIVMP